MELILKLLITIVFWSIINRIIWHYYPDQEPKGFLKWIYDLPAYIAGFIIGVLVSG